MKDDIDCRLYMSKPSDVTAIECEFTMMGEKYIFMANEPYVVNLISQLKTELALTLPSNGMLVVTIPSTIYLNKDEAQKLHDSLTEALLTHHAAYSKTKDAEQ